MRKKRKKLVIAASILFSVGIIIGGCIIGSYIVNQKIIESKIENFNERVDAVKAQQSENYNDNEKNDDSSQEDNSKLSQSNNAEINTNNSGNTGYKLDYTIDLTALRNDCQSYNSALIGVQGEKLENKESYTYSALDLSKYGIPDDIFGYIKAPDIGMELPIYLGANEYNMMYGAAHFGYTSLPIGGENTNAVFAGHTGYLGRWLFDDIGKLKKGNIVTISTYLGTLNYEVKEVKIKKPSESNDIYIERGKDKITLVTCTYLSDGSYMRYIVVCERT